MKRRGSSCFLAALAAGGLLLPADLLAAGPVAAVRSPAETSTPVQDAALDAEGALKGTLVDGAGAPLAGASVQALRGSTVAGNATADARGQFKISGLRGGVYRLAAAGNSTLVRAWSAKSAPPAASDSLLLVSGGPVVRGQMPLRDIVTCDAMIIGGIAAVAIAVPLIVHATRNDNGSGS